MRIPNIALSLAVLASLSPHAVQTPDAGAGATKPSAAEHRPLDDKLAAMQGLWRLTEMRSPKSESLRRSEVGFVIVSGLCFSMELHWGWTGPDGQRIVGKDFQSGMHRFELDDAGNMESRSLIGSFMNRDGLLQWEEPGRVRRYRLEVLGELMKWSNEEGVSFTFEHVPEPRTARRDVFGRPIPEKKKEPPPPAPPK